MFTGAMVALVTPFHEGEIDWETLDELIEFQLENGIDAIVPVGTTGESPTLSHEEHKQVMERVVKGAGGSVPVIPGAGSNSTAEAIELTAYAKKVGADATLQVCPYYNKPTQEGFYQHFQAIAEEVQYPRSLRRRHDAGNCCASVRAGQHRSHQGSHRQSRSSVGDRYAL